MDNLFIALRCSVLGSTVEVAPILIDIAQATALLASHQSFDLVDVMWDWPSVLVELHLKTLGPLRPFNWKL
jgi:hypothetical protein